MLRSLASAAGFGPALFGDLAGAADAERAGGNSFGDAGAGADVGAFADGDGSDEVESLPMKASRPMVVVCLLTPS